VARVAADGDDAGQVDARDQRVLTHDPAVSPGGQAVLVVDRGVLDPDRDAAGHQSVRCPLAQTEADAVTSLVDDQSAERLHGSPPPRVLASAYWRCGRTSEQTTVALRAARVVASVRTEPRLDLALHPGQRHFEIALAQGERQIAARPLQ